MTMATQGYALAQTHNERNKKAAHDPQHLLTRQGGQEPPCGVKPPPILRSIDRRQSPSLPRERSPTSSLFVSGVIRSPPTCSSASSLSNALSAKSLKTSCYKIDLRFQSSAVMTLQEAAEAYLV